MAFSLPTSVYSPTLLESVAYETAQYLDWYRQAAVQKQVGAAVTEEPSFSAETVETVQAWFADATPTVEGLEQLVATLRELKLPVAHLTMAALPNHAQRAQLVDWFRLNVAPGVLVSFTADRTLGGGIVVRTPNRLIDASWKRQLLEGRTRLAEIVHNV